MRGFFQRLQYQMAAWMQGRYGMDGLSNFLLAVAIILLLASIVPGLDLLLWLAFIVLVVSMLRSFSKNIPARAKENETYERLSAGPKRTYALAKKAWTNRKTTRYFKCKGCGQVLSVPKGKGTLRVVCPKCKTETRKKS